MLLSNLSPKYNKEKNQALLSFTDLQMIKVLFYY